MHAGRESVCPNWFLEPHPSYYTNGETEKSGFGPTGADGPYLPERNIVTRGPAGSCTISITVDVAVANIDEGLDCLVRVVTKYVLWQ